MSACKICFNKYDHSLRKPYHLSCPHTFCKDCIIKIQIYANQCPACRLPIRETYPNIELLETIPESNYERLENWRRKVNEYQEIFNLIISNPQRASFYLSSSALCLFLCLFFLISVTIVSIQVLINFI